MSEPWDGGIQLWGKQLPEAHFSQVKEIYDGVDFPLEARLQLAVWIEEKFTPMLTTCGEGLVFEVDDPANQQMATSVAQELMQQLDAKIQSMPQDPANFLNKSKLQGISTTLKVSE